MDCYEDVRCAKKSIVSHGNVNTWEHGRIDLAMSLDTQPLHTLIIAFLGSIRNCRRKFGSMVDDDLHGGTGGDEDPLSIQFWRSPSEYRELPEG